ncbi:DsbA family protein [Dongia sp.]|uniref:DsbA family protein n=1 Tax=Dongia sp. TaxID=1977262 RepID=UPI0035AEFB9B
MNKRTARAATAGVVILAAAAVSIWSLMQSPGAPAKAAILDKLPPPVEHDLATIQPGEVILGSESAPVTIVEYASMSCPHCAAFHKDVLPALKAAYLDTGKAKLVLRDFPLNKPAVEGALLARCVSPMAYWAMVDRLFSTQQQWVVEDSFRQLSSLAATAGLSPDAFAQCQANTQMKDTIINSLQQAETVFGVNSTPSFVINGVVLKEDNSLETIKAVVDALSPAT